jgi:hypothetical protein
MGQIHMSEWHKSVSTAVGKYAWPACSTLDEVHFDIVGLALVTLGMSPTQCCILSAGILLWQETLWKLATKRWGSWWKKL